MVQTFMKIGGILFEISWRQTDKQTNRGKNITPSAGKEKGVEITLKTENYLFSLFCMANYFCLKADVFSPAVFSPVVKYGTDFHEILWWKGWP